MPTEYLKLRDDEGWWFHIGNQFGALRVQYPEPIPGQVELTKSPVRDAWWFGPTDTDEVVVVREKRDRVGAILRDPDMASEKLTLRLPAAELSQLVDDDSPLAPLYCYEQGPAYEVFESIDLTGAPELGGVPKDTSIIPTGSTWSANLPSELRHHPEFTHLFPGRLNNFRQVARDTLDKVPGVSAYDEGAQGLKGWVKVMYPDLFEGVPARRVRKSPRSKQFVDDPNTPFTSMRWQLRVPGAIEGENLVAAVAEWERRIGEYVAWFTTTQARARELVAQLPVPGGTIPEPPTGLTLRRDA